MCDCKKHRLRFSKCTCLCPEHKNFELALKLAVERYGIIHRQNELIEALQRSLEKAAPDKVDRDNPWVLIYGHEDCDKCEELVQEAVKHAERAGTASQQMVCSLEGHMGAARRSG